MTISRHIDTALKMAIILGGFALLAANGCRGQVPDTVDVESFDLHKVIGEGAERIILRFDDPYADQVMYRVYTKAGGWTVNKQTSFLRSGEICFQGLRNRQNGRIVTKWFETGCVGFKQTAREHNRAVQRSIAQKNGKKI